MKSLAKLLLVLPLTGCGVAGIGGFARYDGRWVADIGPRPGCCPARIVFDVDGHKLAGTAEDCRGTRPFSGRIDEHGQAVITLADTRSHLALAGENFSGPLPGDACGRIAQGNRGG